MIKQPLPLRVACLIIGIALIPAAFAVTYTVVEEIIACVDFLPNVLTFFVGFASYLIFFLAFRKPMLAYVFGHEITHAMWVLLFRGKVKSIRVTKNGGAVKATKANPLIILAPYFFPLYTLLVMGVWLLLSRLYAIEKYFPIAIFLIGFTWSFHFLLNIYILRENQDDVRAVGHVFSFILIYILNVFILGLLITFIAESLTLRTLFDGIRQNIGSPYQQVWTWILEGIEYLRNQTAIN